MSNSVWPHRWQPTRLPRPWDSPGKNTGVCCHFVLQWVKVKRESEVAQLCPTLSDPMDCSLPGSSIHGIFQAKLLEWVAIAFSALKRTTPFYGNPSHPSQRVLFLPPSDAYVRSFFYLLYTLIKLYYTKALSNQASSLAPDWILLLRGPRIPVSSRDLKTTISSWGLVRDPSGQGKDAWSFRSLFSWRTRFLLCFTNSTVCLCEWMTCPAWSK